ncbi:MAG: hypothetical protein K8R69_10450 [Deltaproteobacteria bacterium]|nr:hypothetical protein [Deltaproteobacteria bacterium]
MAAEETPPHKWDLIAKAATAIGALLAGVAIPIVINYNQEKNRETQLYVQIMTQREQSDSTLRSQMFNALIGSYFGDDILKDPEKQMMYLHLLSLNFQEFFDARPLFEDLNRRVNPEQKARLLAIAKDAADRQVNLLTKPDNEPTELQLCVESKDDCKNMTTFSLKGKDGVYPFAVRLQEVTPSEIRVRVSSASEKFNFKTIEFTVSYFDTPFMNNTKLMDGSRFSFVLENADADRKIASIEVVAFPEEYMNLRDRPYFDEMLSRLGSKGDIGKGK